MNFPNPNNPFKTISKPPKPESSPDLRSGPPTLSRKPFESERHRMAIIGMFFQDGLTGPVSLRRVPAPRGRREVFGAIRLKPRSVGP